MHVWLIVGLAGLLSLVASTRASAQQSATLTLSGGLDLRAGLQVEPTVETETGLSSAFLNVRTVFADAQGDRLILVAQGDVEEGIDNSHLYQAYGQYKGPLGRWNLRAGRYLVPFGLLAYYDTERLLLAAHEVEALGIKLDEGVELFGYFGAFDYAVSVSRGYDDRPTPIARVGWQGQDVRLGLSYLYGRLPSYADDEVVPLKDLLSGARLINKNRVAIDYEQLFGPLTVRAEPIAGTDDGRFVAGAYLEAGYALSPRWELAANAAVLDSDLVGTRWRAGPALSFRVLPGVFVRGAYEHRNDFGEATDLFLVQVYGEYSRTWALPSRGKSHGAAP
ncbi:MAG: hypothetical protein SFX73_34640 [Kofleriaceae bacterium]|nr:hypothetical protein [Kofleriaceae bacterium]